MYDNQNQTAPTNPMNTLTPMRTVRAQAEPGRKQITPLDEVQHGLSDAVVKLDHLIGVARELADRLQGAPPRPGDVGKEPTSSSYGLVPGLRDTLSMVHGRIGLLAEELERLANT